MTTPAAREREGDDSKLPPPVGSFVLLGLAGLLYCGMMGSLSGMQGTDAAGRGMALAFAAIFGVALWLVLALLLTVASVVGHMPLAGRVGAAILLPLSAVAASVAIDLYGGGSDDWAIAVPLLLPPVIAAYALWARLPEVQARLPERRTTVVLGGTVMLLTLAPLAVSVGNALPDRQRDARQEAAQKEHEERLQREERDALKRESAEFAKLGPDSPLSDYLQYLPGGDTRSRQALEGARRVKSRQTDAVALLKAGRINGLSDLFRLDLQVTPDLCRAFDDALAAEADKITRARSDYLSIAIGLEQQLPNIKWLSAGGCDLERSLGLLVKHVRAVSDSSRMQRFAVTLDGYRSSR